MTALFADTFYWIALMDPNDSAHKQALEITAGFNGSVILVTTDEVLAEYLTFFGQAHERIRRTAFKNAQRVLSNSKVQVISQGHETFLLGQGNLWSASR